MSIFDMFRGNNQPEETPEVKRQNRKDRVNLSLEVAGQFFDKMVQELHIAQSEVSLEKEVTEDQIEFLKSEIQEEEEVLEFLKQKESDINRVTQNVIKNFSFQTTNTEDLSDEEFDSTGNETED